jgi:hypothetical protein
MSLFKSTDNYHLEDSMPVLIEDYKCSRCNEVITGNCRIENGRIVLRCNVCQLDYVHDSVKCYYCGKIPPMVNFDHNRGTGWYRCYCIDCAFNRIAKKNAIPPHPYTMAFLWLPMGLFFICGPVAAYFIAGASGGWNLKNLSMCILAGMVFAAPGVYNLIKRRENSVIELQRLQP